MSRKIEDFDDNCDPDNPKTIKHDDVVDAALKISPFIPRVPLLYSHCCRKFGIHVYYKLESLLHTGSFKERGILHVFHKMPLDKKKLGVVIASLGNEGIAASYHGSKMGIPVIVVVPTTVPASHMQRCHALGANVIVQGVNLHESMRYARAIARDKGLTYINGRDHPQMLMGYGTIALEILEEHPNVDAVIVPVGMGGLAAAVSAVIKHRKPNCLVYGVQPETVPLFFKNLENETDAPVLVVNKPTVADSINVTALGTNSFSTAKPFMDKMLLVKEEWIVRAMLHMSERQKLVVEGAGACPLAAIIGNLVPELKLKHTVLIISGGTVNPLVYNRCLQRGLSAEGRLVKFRVLIKDQTSAQTTLLRLLANGGFNIMHQFQTHRWVESDEYLLEGRQSIKDLLKILTPHLTKIGELQDDCNDGELVLVIIIYNTPKLHVDVPLLNLTVCELELVCIAKSLEHALELKRIIERAYPCYSVFETEPFNDKRVCPCYVYKGVCAY